MPQSIVNFECFDTSIQNITHTNEWKQLQNTFNEKKVIILFGHGGNMGVCDHGSIDISRLTDKTSLSPGSAILCTSLISDFSFETWIKEWLLILLRNINEKDVLVLGNSCSVGSKSSQSIINALEFAHEKGCETAIISARNKGDILLNTTKIITNSIYYHTHECLSLMLIYQLIYGYKNSDFNLDLVDCPPSIKVKSVDNEEISFDINTKRDVPPGLEKDSNNIAIDFDGVLHNFDKGYYDGTCYGEPIYGSQEALKQLSQKYNIIIFSSKCLPDRPLVNGLSGRELIMGWLQKYDLLKYVKDITHIKPRAKYYIDDKAISFKNNWQEILSQL
jgi:phosphoheptose isomerase